MISKSSTIRHLSSFGQSVWRDKLFPYENYQSGSTLPFGGEYAWTPLFYPIPIFGVLDTIILANRSTGNALCVLFHMYSCVGLLVPILSASLALRCTWPLGCLYSYVLPYTLFHHVSFQTPNLNGCCDR